MNLQTALKIAKAIYKHPLSMSDSQSLRRQLAKAANQRIRRLEAASSAITGESYGSYGAIDLVKDYLEQQGRSRFSESLNIYSDHNQLRREIAVLEGFLTSKTSTVSGQKEAERKRMETFESGKWGTRYRRTGELNKQITFSNNKEFYDFLNSQQYKDLLSSGYSSEQLIEIYEEGRIEGLNDDQIYDIFNEAINEFRKNQNGNLKELRQKFGFTQPLK